MAVNQANYPMGVDTSISGYPIPKMSIDGQSVVNGSQVKMTQYGTTGIAEIVNADGSTNATMVGRNYQETTLLNLAILDTILHTGTVMNINTQAGNSNILIDNPLDQPVTLTIYVKNILGKTFQVWTGSVASAGQKILTDADIPILKTPLYQIYVTAQCTVAPTVGTLTATFGGVQA